MSLIKFQQSQMSGTLAGSVSDRVENLLAQNRTLSDDLNDLRTQIRKIQGTDTWTMTLSGSQDLAVIEKAIKVDDTTVDFTGDVYVADDAFVSGSLEAAGVVKSFGGFSGSLTRLSGGGDYLLAGKNITTVTGALGDIEITANPGNVTNGVQYNVDGYFTANEKFTFAMGPSEGRLHLSGSMSQGNDSHVLAGALGSHAEGRNTAAYSQDAHTEGYLTKAGGVEISAFYTVDGNLDVSGDHQDILSDGGSAAVYIKQENGNIIHATLSGIGTYSSEADETTFYITGGSSFGVLPRGSVVTILSADPALFSMGTMLDGEMHAEGRGVWAAGVGSHAEGIFTKAFGDRSHTEGDQTITTGPAAHAEGEHALASGMASHAEGFDTTAANAYSHAEGFRTLAYGSSAHAEGFSTQTGLIGFSNALIDEDVESPNYGKLLLPGVDATSYVQALTVAYLAADIKQVFTITCVDSDYSNGMTICDIGWTPSSGIPSGATLLLTYDMQTVSNSGKRNLLLAPEIGALDIALNGSKAHAEGEFTVAGGQSSHAEGKDVIAYGYASHAEGELTKTYGQASHAEGYRTVVIGAAAHAEGYMTTGSADYAHSEGRWTEASGLFSHAEGDLTTAGGAGSHAEGSGSIAMGLASHAEGYIASAPASYSHAEGWLTISSGSWSHAEGKAAITSGSWSHAEGIFTIARGEGSHAEGSGSLSVGIGSHAEGKDTTALGNFSHAGGVGSLASGYGSIAMGFGSVAAGNFSVAAGDHTVSSGSYQTVFGRWNKENNSDSVFIIGGGTSDNDRRDLMLIGQNTIMMGSASLAPDTFFHVATSGEADKAKFDGSILVDGFVKSVGGFSGSLTKLVDGSDYLVAGVGVSVAVNPNGSITISANSNSTVKGYFAGNSGHLSGNTFTFGPDGAGLGTLSVGTDEFIDVYLNGVYLSFGAGRDITSVGTTTFDLNPNIASSLTSDDVISIVLRNLM